MIKEAIGFGATVEEAYEEAKNNLCDLLLGTKYNEEDIEYYKSIHTNYYPVEGENIAGSLGEEYLRIVDACKTRTSALDQMLMVVPQEQQDPYRRHM